MRKKRQNWNFNISEVVNVKPPLYNIVLLNSAYITKPSFISMISKFFNVKESEYKKYYEKLLANGELIMGVHTKDVAETKVAELNLFTKENYFNCNFFIKKT